jgi:hypothetical protein
MSAVPRHDHHAEGDAAMSAVRLRRGRHVSGPTPTIIEFVTDPQLLGLSISPAQRTLLKSIYGLPLDEEELALFRECTGRTAYPGLPFGEVTVVAGARSGKDSRIAAPIVCYEAVFGGHERHLARGERGIIPLVAQDQRATRVAFGYIRDYLTWSRALAPMVTDGGVLASEIRLTNRMSLLCFPCTLKSLRAFSMPVGVLDEVAFYRLEGAADSDAEIQASIRRGMISFPQTKLVKISTPYMKSGILYDDFKRAFGQDDPDLLVWRASSLLMNPSLRAERLDRERRLDPSRFAREYEAEFAEDVATFLPAALVDGAVQVGRRELPPQRGCRYVGACDTSGGGLCAFTFSIVHVEGDGAARRVVQDVMRTWSKPRGGQTDLEGAVREISAIAKRYSVTTVVGDRYARGWVREAFKRNGITYQDATVAGKGGESVYLDKSAAYLEAEPLFAQGLVEILDNLVLERELKNLERRPQPGGKDRVDHPRGQYDDHANALALAVAVAASQAARRPWTPAHSAAFASSSASLWRPSLADRFSGGDREHHEF